MLSPRYSFCLLALSAVLAGCVSPTSNYQPAPTEISQPALGSTNTAQVGEEMLKQGKFFERDAIRLAEPIKFSSWGFTAYTAMPGIYVKTGENSDTEFFEPAPGRDGGSIQKATLADMWKSVQLKKDGKKIGMITIFNVAVNEDAIGVTKTKWLALSDNSFQQTLIYSGRVGGKIKVGYREFSNNQARPAFNNDVEYDLNESSTIGYKGARLDVLEATNEHIRYKVIQNFNRAEL